MRAFFAFAIVMSAFSVANAEEGNCVVSSRGQEIDNLKFYSTFAGSPTHYSIRQNDGSSVNYDISVLAVGGPLRISISNHDKLVSVDSWQATELVAQGSTQLQVGANLVVETGLEELTLKSLVSVSCTVTR